MNIFKEPEFDRTMNRWHVDEVDPHTDRIIETYDFYDETDARQFFYENEIQTGVMMGAIG